ncbi:hypothetical protein CERZMDRAFT_88239 [Cercospora zeae-maydis SCOH1-5]|uniref:Aminoglycoside phosphotransferase domain-containing protein n=1 Tax=Cercospora zeae-maydis SCOH1-5 TaxID=717836 RepID=A0A6A6EZX9_9PEZI|nr:hypothetical protein CERZMDRAFT_88239 [Cercospora zeae-maydis SCOH1-5]
MPDAAPLVQLLQASVDEDEESHFRFLCDGKYVKYVTVAAGLYTADEMCFGPAFVPLLPRFPPGDWNCGHIMKCPANRTPYFASVTNTKLPSIQSVWHPISVDCLDLTYGNKLRSGVYEATSPQFSQTIVAKFARFPWEIDALEKETEAYQWIDGQDIGPIFLGHLVEEGRTIGFLMENITDARHASENDLEICRHKLCSLHRLGILHGDVNKYNFLITNSHATLLDFESARKCTNQEELDKELQSLSQQLGDTSGRGGNIQVSYES